MLHRSLGARASRGRPAAGAGAARRSVEVEAEGVTPQQLGFYAGLCGMTLARGHARSGDAVAIRSYAGKSATLDASIVAFAESYAAQNLEDFQRFEQAIADGRLECAERE